MNRKGSTMLAILFAICFFLFGMILYQYIKPDIAVQRDADHMNCAAAATSGDRMICLIFDGVIPMAILGIISATGGIIFNKVIL